MGPPSAELDRRHRLAEMASAYADLSRVTNYQSPPEDPKTPYLQSMNEGARDFIARIHHEANSFISSSRNIADFETQVDVIIGVPTAGKSWVRKRQKTIADAYVEEALPLPGAFRALTGREPIKEVTWEKSKQTAREKGKILTPRTELSTAKDLFITNDQIEQDLEEAIGTSLGVLVELPVITEARARGKWAGLEYGARVLERLIKRQGRFTDSPLYRVKIRGVVPGPLQRIFGGLYRDAMHGSRSLKEARQIAKFFNQPPPGNKEEWMQLKREGATRTQRAMVSDSTQKTIDRLWVAGKIESRTSPEDTQEADLMRIIVTEDITLPAEDLAIFLNKNIDITTPEQLKEFLERYGQV